MSYLSNALKHHDSELVKKVYNAMKQNPYNDDWYKLVQNDFNALNIY